MKYLWIGIGLILWLSGISGTVTEIDPLLQEQMLQKAVQTITDSLAQIKEREILGKYGFRETNTLPEVANVLKVQDYALWKRFLELDPNNARLDLRSLRDLGISAYRAQLAFESATLGFNELNTVSEVSTLLQVPIKKFKQLNLDIKNPFDRDIDVMTLQRLQLNPMEVKEICDQYQETRLAHGLSITLVGMLIVFFALLITSLIISQLHRVNRAPTTPAPKIIKVNPLDVGELSLSAPRHSPHLSSNDIIAAITTLHLHLHSIEERRRLMLTFKRASVNLWHASRVTALPNYRFARRGQ